jgi:tetratricopeptide (TPR) repeat protein
MPRFWGLPLTGALALGLILAPQQAQTALSSDPQWQLGKSHLGEGQAEEAKRVFESLLGKYSREPDLYLFLGIAELRLRNPQAAEFQIGKALDLAPEHVEARTLLGWVELEIHKDYDAAIAQYTRVTQLRPEFPEAHNNLGVAWQKKGDWEKALQAFNMALDLRPDYVEALSNRGWVYLRQKNWLRARDDFEKGIRGNPQHEGCLYGLSQVFRETRNYPGAQEALAKLTAQSSNFVYWLERGEIQLLRFYWVLVLLAVGLFLRAQYRKKKLRRIRDGS